MGRNKDTANSLPVEHYRKQIGKQDYKKSKVDLKETKAKSQAKRGIGSMYKDISLLIGSILACIGILYIMLYLYLDNKDSATIM